MTTKTTVKNYHDRIGIFNCIRNSALNGDHKDSDVRDDIVKLIVAYQNGDGTDPDQVKAFEWLLKAVKLDPPITSLYYDIGLAHLEGIGTPINLKEFKKFMERAANENKDIEAMSQLAKAYEKGTFGKISLKDSFEWRYKMATSEDGDPGAMILVSRAYKTGRGIPKNIDECKKFAKNAVKAAKLAAKLAKKESMELDPELEQEGSAIYDHKLIRSWVKDDLARALAHCAEIEKPKIKYKELDFLGQASKAALEFIEGAIPRGEECSSYVINIMVRHVKRLESNDGNVLPGKESIYFPWIEKISCAIEQAGNNLLNELSADLKRLIYNFACACKSGTGIGQDENKHEKWLNFAAKIKSPDAIYTLALKALEEGDPKIGKNDPDYQRYLKDAKDLGNIDAYIRQSLDKCGFPKEENEKLFNLFKELVKVKDNIKKKHRLQPKDYKKGLAHYTNLKALKSMLTVDPLVETKPNVLRLYNIAYANDPDEGKRLVKAENSPLAEFFKDSAPNDPTPWKNSDPLVHIGSFSLVTDKLSLWRAYGRDGNGFCVTIPKSFFSEQHERSLMKGSWESNVIDKTINNSFYKVFYEDKQIKETLEELSSILSDIRTAAPIEKHDEVIPLVRMLLGELLFLYKNEEYSSEEEVRVIQRAELSDSLLNRHDDELHSRLYIETSSIFFEAEKSKIIIGPKVADKDTAMIDINHNLTRHWWNGTCDVIHSKNRYR